MAAKVSGYQQPDFKVIILLYEIFYLIGYLIQLRAVGSCSSNTGQKVKPS